MAVTLDVFAGSRVTNTGIATIDESLKVASNSNRALFVLVGNDSSLTVSSVSYTVGSGGVWAQVGSRTNGVHINEIWSSVAPSTGSVTIRVTLSGNITVDCNSNVYSLYNVDQTTPADGYASAISGNTITAVQTSGGMAIGHFQGISSFGAITAGVEDFANINNEDWRAAHNSASGTLTYTNTPGGVTIDACNVRQVASAAGFLLSVPLTLVIV